MSESKVIDLKKISEHLGVEKEVDLRAAGDQMLLDAEAKTEIKPVGKIIQAHVSYKIAPRGTYSSVEVGKVVEINTTDRDTVNGIVTQLKHEVLEDTIDAATLMLRKAREADLI